MSEGQGRDVQAKDSDGLDSAAAAFGSHGAAVEALEAVDLDREYGTVTLAEARELFPWMLEELATISPSCPGVVCPQTYTVWQVRDIPTPRAASGHTCDAVGAYLFELDSACCHRRVRFLSSGHWRFRDPDSGSAAPRPWLPQAMHTPLSYQKFRRVCDLHVEKSFGSKVVLRRSLEPHVERWYTTFEGKPPFFPNTQN